MNLFFFIWLRTLQKYPDVKSICTFFLFYCIFVIWGRDGVVGFSGGWPISICVFRLVWVNGRCSWHSWVRRTCDYFDWQLTQDWLVVDKDLKDRSRLVGYRVHVGHLTPFSTHSLRQMFSSRASKKINSPGAACETLPRRFPFPES